MRAWRSCSPRRQHTAPPTGPWRSSRHRGYRAGLGGRTSLSGRSSHRDLPGDFGSSADGNSRAHPGRAMRRSDSPCDPAHSHLKQSCKPLQRPSWLTAPRRSHGSAFYDLTTAPPLLPLRTGREQWPTLLTPHDSVISTRLTWMTRWSASTVSRSSTRTAGSADRRVRRRCDARRVDHIVVDSGGWFTSGRLLLPVGHAAVAPDRKSLRTDVTRDALLRLPEFEADRFLEVH